MPAADGDGWRAGQGVALSAVRGSGPGGRIQSRDVRAAMTTDEVLTTNKAPQLPAISELPSWRGRTIPLSPMRRNYRTAPHTERPGDSTIHGYRPGQSAPHAGTGRRIALTAPAMVHGQLVTALLVKACAEALRRVPEVNGSFGEEAITLWG